MTLRSRVMAAFRSARTANVSVIARRILVSKRVASKKLSTKSGAVMMIPLTPAKWKLSPNSTVKNRTMAMAPNMP